MENRTTTSFDGVRIAYSISGSAETALVFIHGGMSDRSFFDGQHAAFSGQYRVIAVDLAGHGESGVDREQWSVPNFGRDTVAVLDAENVGRAVLIGNSLGGPAAVEAALLVGPRALVVIGIDTLQDVRGAMEQAHVDRMADQWLKDPEGSMTQMLAALLYPDMDRPLFEDIRRRMSAMPAEVVAKMFRGFGGYNLGDSARKLQIPVRCINGDRFPTDFEAIRTVLPDFDAAILPHTGHYPMLECPADFNRSLREILQRLAIH